MDEEATKDRIEYHNSNEVPMKVIVTDIKMPMRSMISFMVKWAVASIPAVLILTLLFYLASLYIFSFFHTSF